MAGWQQEKTGRQGLLRNWQVERNGMERNKTISGQTLEDEKWRKRPAGMGCVRFNPSRERLGYGMNRELFSQP